MAAYPSTLKQLLGSTRESVDDLDVDYALAGNAKGIAYYTVAKSRFKLVHVLTASELATLVSFYDTNRTLSISFTWQKTGTAYPTCIFGGPIREVANPSPGLTRVEVTVVQQ